MGSRSDDKLKEIEQLRASLGRKLDEIEQRFPLAGMGKKIGAGLAGSSVAATALGFGFRRLRGGKKKKAEKGRRRGKEPAYTPTAVTVNVFPKGAAWLAAAGLAGWAGVKAYEAIKRSRNGETQEFRPAVVKPMDTGRGVGN